MLPERVREFVEEYWTPVSVQALEACVQECPGILELAKKVRKERSMKDAVAYLRHHCAEHSDHPPALIELNYLIGNL